MVYALRSTWALFLGIALFMLCNGLQGALLGVRSGMEGFSSTMTGLIMSGYFIGIFSGSILVPKLIGNVGHIRVFAALASLASGSVLIYAVFIDPWLWTAMRITTGFSYAGLYIVSESWLNEKTGNENRGQLLSMYMIVGMSAYAIGQLLLNLSSPTDFMLFILASVLVSFSLIPISLSRMDAPVIEQPERLNLLQLFPYSPLGVVGSIGTGMGNGILIGMGAVYGVAIGLTVAEITILITAVQVGSLLLQWPIGRLSDHYDRRIMITVVTFAIVVFALLGIPLESIGGWPLFILFAILGGLNLPMYSLCIAHTNDHLNPSQMIAASGSLVLANGLGGSTGPLIAALFMDQVGPSGFLISLALAHAMIGFFAIYRMTRSEAPEEQGTFVPVDPHAASVMVTLAAEEQIELAEDGHSTDA